MSILLSLWIRNWSLPIYDVFGESGPALELLHKYGLDAEGIYHKIKESIN